MDGLVRYAAISLEMAGAVVILIGAMTATVAFIRQVKKNGFDAAYRGYRADLGRGILLGLELLVAGDILNSVVIDPTLEGLAVLGGIVVIRTFLSISLEVEINGHWPWETTRLMREQSASDR